MTSQEIKETLLLLLPHWNFRIVKPVKQLLMEQISLEMYYCLQTLRYDGMMTMSEFAYHVHMPKHQMSKMANRLFEQELIQRIQDPNDRRTIKIKVTEKAVDYIDHFLEENTECFQELLEEMDEADREAFGESVVTMLQVLSKVAYRETNQAAALKGKNPSKTAAD